MNISASAQHTAAATEPSPAAAGVSAGHYLAAQAIVAGAPLALVWKKRQEPAPQQVLLRVLASGINPLDLKIAAGSAAHARQPLPATLGLDVAGIVEKTGAAVSAFQPGDLVFGMTGGVGGRDGSLAEYQLADARTLAKAPGHIPPATLAALPLVFITAWEGLKERVSVRKGQRVLIHGGAGGVGQMAIQLARLAGARVFATGSQQQAAAIQALGAGFIDYQRESSADYVLRCTAGQGFDLVYDTVGGAVLDQSFQAVRPYHGHVISCLGWSTHSLAPLSFRSASYSGVFTLQPLLSGEQLERQGTIMQQAARLLSQGLLQVQTDPTEFSLAQVNDAYQRLRTRQHSGKLVIRLS